MNVLVFPCGSEIGLEVNRALAHSKHFTLYGGNSVDDHGKFVYKNYISGIPFITDERFIDEINLIVEKYNIQFIIPAHDSVVLKLAENVDLIKAIVLTSCEETCRICRSKKETYKKLKGIIPTPKVYDVNEITFPAFLKPEVGQGSKGTYKVDSIEEVDFYMRKDPTLLALEFLPGKEYTVDCFTDRLGNLLFAEGRERKRINNGISVNSVPIANAEFKRIAELINQHLSFEGVWFFQVKERENGELVLMEVSPRIAGTMELFRAMGVNFIQLALFDRILNYDISILKNNINAQIDKALFARFSIDISYDSVYIDFDDTIIVNDCVNTDAMKFIYQSKNLGKKIFLITKHKYNIVDSLIKYSICASLFEEIIHLSEQDKKSQHINKNNSIFIDDSFAERKEVSDNLGIPVFGVDTIQCLLDWKI